MLDGLKFNLIRGPFYNNFQNFGYFKKLKIGVKISFTNYFLLGAKKFFLNGRKPSHKKENVFLKNYKLATAIKELRRG